MDGNMKAAVMYSAGNMRLEERKIPKIRPDELLIKIEYVGICGSDLHFYEAGRLGNWVADSPLILGHEPGGVVVEAGEAVKDFSPGDRVAIEPGVPCQKCDTCKEGTYNLCPDMSFMAIPGEREGAFMEYCAHPANMCFKLPPQVSTMEGALIEPLAVGLHAVSVSGAKFGQSAVVLGCGCIGLVTIMSLKAAGIDEIYAVDLIEKRLNKAKEAGASRTFAAGKDSIETFVKSLPDGGVDLVYETAGAEVTTLQAAKLVKKGGVVTLVGMCPNPEIKVDIGSLSEKEGTLKTVFRYRNMYPKAIKLISQGKIPLASIVSHIYSFEDICEGVAYNVGHKDDVIKAVIKMQKDGGENEKNNQ